MTDLAAENEELRAQLGNLDYVLGAIEGVGTHVALCLEALVLSFEGDPAHERVTLAVQHLCERVAESCEGMAEAMRRTVH